MSMVTHWQFTPSAERLSGVTARAYRSFTWSMWVFALALVWFLGPLTFLRAPEDFSFPATKWILFAATSLLIGVIFWRWLDRGFDLRTRRTQVEASLMALPAVISGGLSALSSGPAQSAYTITLSACLLGALLAITTTGPNWLMIPVAAIMALPGWAVMGREGAIALAAMSVAMWGSFKLSYWYIDVLDSLESARDTARQLAIAEERLRFSADLHDVMGRNLSAISLKAQLADRLVAREDPAARDQLAEVSSLAHSSLEDVRALVRGYRTPELDEELAGAAALLESAGARVTRVGSPMSLSPDRATITALVIREAATNILRHSNATAVTIGLDPERVTVTNNGVHADDDGPAARRTETSSGTGIDALRQRIGAAGSLSHERRGDSFTLRVDFTPAEEHS